MRRTILIFVFFALAAAGVSEAYGQWLPERRFIRKGNKEYEAGNYAEGEVNYRRAQEKAPWSYAAEYNAAVSIYKQERYEEAEQAFSQLAADSVRTEHSAQSYYNAGNSMVRQRKLQEALEAYKQAMRRDPSDMEAKFNYAYTKKLLEKDNGGGGGEGQDENQQDKDQQDKDQQNKDNQQDKDNQKDQDKPDDQSDGGDEPDKKDGDKDKSEGQDKPDDKQGDGDKPKDGQGDKPGGQDKGGQQPQGGMSKEDAEKLLGVTQENEDKTRENAEKRRAVPVGRSGKNW